MDLETDRIGMELEVEDIEQRAIPNTDVWNTTHDASTERNSMYLYKRNKNYFFKCNGTNPFQRRTERVVMGGELVTHNPLYYSTKEPEFFDKSLDSMLRTLVDLGESPFSYRGSIHIHVNFPIWGHGDEFPLSVLKRTIAVGAHLEELFYHLGGMGYKYRGVKLNNSAYCRPITGKGPQIVGCDTENGLARVQIFVLEDLLESKSPYEFYKKMGNVPLEIGSVERYHPARYTWLNLYSPVMRRTLEFRVFNKSLSKPLITSIIRLCQEVTASIFYNSLKTSELEENSIYNSVNCNRSHDLLDGFLSNTKKLFYLTDKNIELLHMIIANSELSGSEFGNKYVYTHLRRYDRESGRGLYSTNNGYHPPFITESVLDSSFVDIHNMYGRR